MMRGEPQVIQAIDESAEVIMNNCIRCHTQLNTEFVKTGKIDATDGSTVLTNVSYKLEF